VELISSVTRIWCEGTRTEVPRLRNWANMRRYIAIPAYYGDQG